jgi:hypothetical protein
LAATEYFQLSDTEQVRNTSELGEVSEMSMTVHEVGGGAPEDDASEDEFLHGG